MDRRECEIFEISIKIEYENLVDWIGTLEIVFKAKLVLEIYHSTEYRT